MWNLKKLILTTLFTKQKRTDIWIVVQSLSRVQLFATPWAAARQASLSFTISRGLLKLMSIKSLMPSNHLIPCHNPSVWSFAIFMNTQGKRGGWNE